MAKGIQAALKDLRDLVDDLTTLEVYTYGGTLETTDIDGQAIKWEKFTPGAGSNLKLVAATKVLVDFDAYSFQSSDTSIANRVELLKLHAATVESSQQGRAELLKTFLELLPGGFDTPAAGGGT